MRHAMAPFSSRSRFAERPNQLTAALLELRATGRPLLDLTESNPTRVGLSPGAAELAAALASSESALYAPEPFGLASARAAVSAELAAAGFAVDPADVLLTSSTSEAYGLLFKLLCEPGDELLVPSPSYPLLDVLAQLEQVRLVPYPLRYDGEWHIDVAALRAACGPRTRAIVAVSPNNPTGSYLKRSELAQLAALGLPLISDEVFADFALREDPERAASALSTSDGALVFRLSGLSKACALPQLKLAWTVVAGPTALVEEARLRLEHMADAYLSPSTPVQLALPTLLVAGPRIRAAISARARRNLAELTRALAGSAADVLNVEGGWYAIVRAPAVLDDEAWALTLLHEDALLVQPGYYYDLQGTQLVLSLICEEPTFAEGARRLAARVQAISG